MKMDDVIAKIKCKTLPAMATVRITENTQNEVIISAGKGAKDVVDQIKNYADKNGFGFGASRPVVDMGLAKYENQVGIKKKNTPLFSVISAIPSAFKTSKTFLLIADFSASTSAIYLASILYVT